MFLFLLTPVLWDTTLFHIASGGISKQVFCLTAAARQNEIKLACKSSINKNILVRVLCPQTSIPSAAIHRQLTVTGRAGPTPSDGIRPLRKVFSG